MATTSKPADSHTDTDSNATGGPVSASDIAAIRDALGAINTKLDKQQRTLDKHTQQLKGIRSKQADTDNSLLLTKAQNQLMAMGIYVALLALLYFVQAIKNAAADMPGWLQKAIGVEEVAAPGQLPPRTAGLTNEQLDNAEAIIAAGRSLDGITDRDIQIALMAALQESALRNLNHGDDWWFARWGEKSDSRGLFQQRDSWGTQECRMTPECSAKLFYEALLKIPGREAMSLGAAAQAVQNSAFPDEYDKWEAMAKELLEASIPSGTSSTPLKSGDMIGQFRVSRGTIPGEHEGVDVATPEGTPLFVFGQKGESIIVECSRQMEGNTLAGWGIYGTFHVPSTGKSFLVGHLSECNPGTYQAGEVWGYSGNTGRSTGPHTHTEQFNGTKTGYAALPEEPTRAYVEAIHGVFQ